jgi:drug/metabolite transporter (DMT)-like permease
MGERKTFSVTDFYLIVATVIWGSDYLFAKISLREVTPLNFAAIRTLISMAIMLPFFMKAEKGWRVTGRHLGGLVFLSFLGIFLNRMLWSAGLDLTTASNSALIGTTSPLFVLLFTFLARRAEISLRVFFGVLLAFFGVFLVVRGDWREWDLGARTFLGDLLLMGSAMTWALFTFLSRRILKTHSSLKVTAYLIIIGTIFFLPFFPNEKPGGWAAVSFWGWFGIVYVAVMGNALAYFLWMKGVEAIGPMRTILYQYLMPVTAILFAVPFLGERLTGEQVAGAVMVFAGIFLARSD